ncbi:hypothetical protein BDR26DRAFT_916551 [Obelidium mucronatum]|nr:hypothetical protein BDR26DRAFT_916551 [Obelidium mucronatum]
MLHTQADAFKREHPSSDGTATTIAILDTGVDPGAPGLRYTPQGAYKVLELIDCSGAGDVDMSTIAKPIKLSKTTTEPPSDSVVSSNPDDTTQTPITTTISNDTATPVKIMALSGRVLSIPSSWPLPKDSHSYRIGCKSAVSGLFPKEVLAKGVQDRKTAAEKANNALLVHAMTRLSDHEKKFPKLDGPKSLSDDEASVRSNLKAQVDLLKDFMKEYKDPAPLLDFISFHDGTSWHIAVDVSMTGDLSKSKLLKPYSEAHQYDVFGDTGLNYSFNVYDDGDMISMVSPCKSHGTHVAAIAAAYFPTNPSANGVAPGAQIVSLKIGDTRFGSQETAQSLVRAANELCRLKVDVVNISYGEFSGTYDYGRFTELVKNEVINKLGTVFISSAGNAGPILSSLSHPGGNSGVITVGAHISESMQNELYAMLENVPERAFSFSSMGPTLDGAVGVDVYAPGAAITSVAQYTKSFSQLMNGTSMACPYASGCVALLISGLKQKNIPYTPYRIGRALRRSAKQFGDEFQVGLIQVLDAWADLTLDVKDENRCLDVHYEINVTQLNKARGIYLRELEETNSKQQFSVNIKPVFPKATLPESHHDQLHFDAQIRFVSSTPWITAPKFLRLNSGGRDFLLRVDPTGLEPGLHYGYVSGVVDGGGVGGGVGECFRIPVTVCKTEKEVPEGQWGVRKFVGLQFDSGLVQRRYLNVPMGSTFATITIKSKHRVGNALFMIQFAQLQQQIPESEYDSRWRVNFSSTGTGVEDDDFRWSKTIRVLPAKVAELVLCQNWSALDPTTISVEIEFHGLELTATSSPTAAFGSRSSGDLIFLNSGNTVFTRCDLFSRLRAESICAPCVVLSALQKSIRPSEASIRVLKGRDVLPDGRQLYQLVLTYPFKVMDEVNVTPVYPQALAAIYDSIFESLLIMIHDSQQAIQSIHHAKVAKIKLKEGSYTAKMQIVSADLLTLEKLKTTPLLINQDLKKSITLSSYKTLAAVLTNGGGSNTNSSTGTNGTFDKMVLPKGQSATFWLPGVSPDDIPKAAAQTGDLLLGKVKLTDASSSDIDVHNVAYLVPSESKVKESGGMVVDIVTPMSKGGAAAGGGEDDDDSRLQQQKGDSSDDALEVKLKEDQRDLEISYIKKYGNNEKRKQLIEKLEQGEWKAFVPFHVAKLEAYLGDFEKAQKKDSQKVPGGGSGGGGSGVGDCVDRLSEACNVLLGEGGGVIDLNALAAYFGMRTDLVAGGEAAKAKKKEMDGQKAAVVLALLCKAKLAKNRILLLPSNAATELKVEAQQDFDGCLTKLAQWMATSEGKYLLLWVWRLRNRGWSGSALKAVCKFLGDSKNSGGEGDKGDKSAVWKEMCVLKKELIDELGWGYWKEYEVVWSAMRNPPSPALF